MRLRSYLASSLGKKQLIALTGLALILVFLIPHLIGNLFLLAGSAAFNGYVEHLHSFGLFLRILETGFAVLFVTHITLSILVVVQNRRARGAQYHRPLIPEPRSFAARSMPYTGAILLIFLVVHLHDFTFAPHTAPASVRGGVDLGLYGVVLNTLSSPVWLIGYSFVLVILGLHLSHAIQSVFQTFGLRRWVREMTWISYAIGALISLGFLSILVAVCL